MMFFNPLGGVLRAIARWNGRAVVVGLSLWMLALTAQHVAPRVSDFAFIGQAQGNMPGTFNPILSSNAAPSVPIGTVTALCVTCLTTTTDATTAAVLTTATATAGNTVFVGVGRYPGTGAKNITAISDNAGTGNTWNVSDCINAATSGSGFFPQISLCSSSNTGGMPIGTTITVTFNIAGSGGNGLGVIAAQVSGISSPTPDKTQTYTGAATQTPTMTTAALTQANSLAVAVSGYIYSPSSTFTETSTFTTLFNKFFFGFGGSFSGMSMSFKTLSSTSAVTYAGSAIWSATPNQASNAVIGIYKGF